MKFSYAFVGIILAFATISEARDLCMKPCTLDINPVCGTDGLESRVFDNACLVQNQHCYDGKFWYQTRMTECYARSETPVCPFLCPFIYAPVCGFDGEKYQIFSNECTMNSEGCFRNQQYTKVSMGECEPAATTKSEKKDCFVPCTREFEPVCGFDGKSYKVFSNKCTMQNAHCEDGHNWVASRMNECENTQVSARKCQIICPAIYAPVCGFDGKEHEVFSNECVLSSQSCLRNHHYTKVAMSECHLKENPLDKDCPQICPEIFAPVCAFDGQEHKVFSNDCLLKAANCLDNHKWRSTRLSECPEVYF